VREPRTAKLAYLSAAVDRQRLITADVHIAVVFVGENTTPIVYQHYGCIVAGIVTL